MSVVDQDLWVRVKELFAEALERSPAERAAYLAEMCGSDAALRREVESLLAAHEKREPGVASPTVDADEFASESARSPDQEMGGRVGPYKLLERIGEGGFGTVYMAEQCEPVQRRVALKVVKPGMDSKEVIARFEAERQALAMMDHPNIARVLDAGTTDALSPLGPGRPYFVMELVRGIPITKFCDENNLTIRQRLELAIDVCHAVQHAHMKGVIHRDLKPSNVLVTLHDDAAVSKVIDFGIAKATQGRLTEKTLFTEFRQLIGTPAYMSPEQAQMSGIDIDTRSDIYSLGVLLYELLTGTTPFDPKRLRSVAYGELQRILREEEPPKPSTRVSTLRSTSHVGEEPTTSVSATSPIEDSSEAGLTARAEACGSSSAIDIFKHRRSDPASLTRSLRGDLDWIVMKCLEKDRNRRYETANGLASDIQRHLNNQPVEAGPPTAAYRFRKFVRRNRAMVTAATMVVAALLVGTAGTTFGLQRAETQRAEAEAAREQTQQVSDFQSEMLRGIDVEAMGHRIKELLREQVQAAMERNYMGESPDRRQRTPEEVETELAAFDQPLDEVHAVDVARRVMDEFVLARAADALEEQFPDQPLVRAQLHLAIGRTYQNLGLYDDAEPHLREALEIRQLHYGSEQAHPEVAECLIELAGLLWYGDKVSEAEPLYREALAMSRDLSNEHRVAMILQELGGVLLLQRKWDDAEPLFNEALRINKELHGDDDRAVVDNLASLAVLRTKQGRLPEAEELNRQVLEWRRQHFDHPHPKVAHVLYNLGQVLDSQGRHAEAEEAFREALAINRAVYGDEHHLVAKFLYVLSTQIVDPDRRREAEDYCRQALALQRELSGDHREVRTTLGKLSAMRQQAGDHDEAVELLRESLAIAERLYPDGNGEAWRRFSAMGRLARALNSQAKVLLDTDRERALELFQEADLLISAIPNPAENDPRRGSLENYRMAIEWRVTIYEFWHNVAPERGWGERAAEWRAELEKLDGS